METSSSSSPSPLNPLTSSSTRAREYRRRKKNTKTDGNLSSQNPHDTPQTGTTPWKSELTQQLYFSKFLQALRHVRLTSPATAASRRGRAVREVADRVLATTARGRTRWSRAILLTNRLHLKFMKRTHKRQRVAATGVNRSPKRPRLEILRLKGKNPSDVQRKVKKLARLVPGCRKETLPVILEEAADYIPALEMEAMVLRNILSQLGALPASAAGEEASEGPSSGGTPAENGSG